MSYWDTSGLVKLYAAEPDSAQFESYAAASAAAAPTIAEITRFELWVALRRKEKEGFIAAGQAKIYLDRFDQDVRHGELHVVELSRQVSDEFERLTERCLSQSPPLLVRTMDMIHLASAQIAVVTEFVTTDKRLREAALAAGFAVYPPAPPKSFTP